jgi:hypothetical protein
VFSIESRPDLTFVVIINPNSGPGSGTYPDDNYTPAIQKLNAYSNVVTIGYVKVGYTSNDISSVLSQINTYAGWSTKSSTLAMHGIFIDESPHVYTSAAFQYLETVDRAIKNAGGLAGARLVSQF